MLEYMVIDDSYKFVPQSKIQDSLRCAQLCIRIKTLNKSMSTGWSQSYPTKKFINSSRITLHLTILLVNGIKSLSYKFITLRVP